MGHPIRRPPRRRPPSMTIPELDSSRTRFTRRQGSATSCDNLAIGRIASPGPPRIPPRSSPSTPNCVLYMPQGADEPDGAARKTTSADRLASGKNVVSTGSTGLPCVRSAWAAASSNKLDNGLQPGTCPSFTRHRHRTRPLGRIGFTTHYSRGCSSGSTRCLVA